jgi:hypothetical protein
MLHGFLPLNHPTTNWGILGDGNVFFLHLRFHLQPEHPKMGYLIDLLDLCLPAFQELLGFTFNQMIATYIHAPNISGNV